MSKSMELVWLHQPSLTLLCHHVLSFSTPVLDETGSGILWNCLPQQYFCNAKGKAQGRANEGKISHSFAIRLLILINTGRRCFKCTLHSCHKKNGKSTRNDVIAIILFLLAVHSINFSPCKKKERNTNIQHAFSKFDCEINNILVNYLRDILK